MEDVKQEKPKTKSRLAREAAQDELWERTLVIRPAKLKDGLPRRARRAFAAGEKARQRAERGAQRRIARLRRAAQAPVPKATEADLQRLQRRAAAENRREDQRLERIAQGTDRATIRARKEREA